MKTICYKKAVAVIAVSLSILLLCTAGLVILVDPFFQYHKPISSFHYVIDNQLSQNAGMIKHFDYDSVILGSSMTLNFDTDLFAETLNLNTLKLSVNAAYPKDIHTMLSLVHKRHENLHTVFLCIDPSTYHAEPEITAYPYPEYLYDENLFNDVYYLFNKDVLLDYILKPQILKQDTRLNEVYWSWPYMTYGKEAIAKTYTAPDITDSLLAEDAYLENTIYNMDTYILPYIEQMEETQFVVFFPPYSILYWYNRMAEGSIDAYMAEIEQITEMLLAYPNVKVYYFQNNYDYITNFDNYCDYTHYNHDMNDYMMECFADDRHQLTKDNYQEILQDMREWLHSFDYENCW